MAQQRHHCIDSCTAICSILTRQYTSYLDLTFYSWYEKEFTRSGSKRFVPKELDRVEYHVLSISKIWDEDSRSKAFLYVHVSNGDEIAGEDTQFFISLLDKNQKRHFITEGFSRRVSDKLHYWAQIAVDHNYVIDPANGFLEDGQLSLRCSIYYNRKSLLPYLPSKEPNKYDHQSVTIDFESLLHNSTLSDLVLIVEGKEFKVHRNILAARSPYFAAMFTSEFKEKTQDRIEITDVELDVFEQLLSYIYSGKIPNMEKYAYKMFVVSDKYQLESLKNICAKSLSTYLTIESVIKVLQLADMHNMDELKSKCIEFITLNSVNIMTTEGWIDFGKRNGTMVVQLFQELAKKAHTMIDKIKIN